jgi:hypothetical protein
LLVLASGPPCQTDGPGPLAFPKGILRKSLHILLCVSAPPSCGIMVTTGFIFCQCILYLYFQVTEGLITISTLAISQL